MALEYLRQNPINDMCGDPTEAVQANPARRKKTTGKKKVAKGKFSALLGGNLIVWVIFLVSIFDLKLFSMQSLKLPKVPQKLPVSGIVYNESEPSAIISNQVYGVGDEVDGYKITNITRTEVEFQKDGETIVRQVR